MATPLPPDPPPCRVVIFGAGSVGCYIGARLLAAGADVVLVGRPRLQTLLQAQPLIATDLTGFRCQLTLPVHRYVGAMAAAGPADLVLVTVKSAATEEAGRQLASHVRSGTPVLSLQNGISNAARLQHMLPAARVLTGMVPFNVLQQAPGHFHQGTEGRLMVELDETLSPALPWFERAGLPLEQRQDMTAVMWSKLLLNLNNPINALSGLPLLEQLSNRDFRRCLAMAQREALAMLKEAGTPTAQLTRLPMAWIPLVMSSPNWLFARLAKQMLAIDPLARSSMWEDLEAGRPTEVDWINGEVVTLAQSLGRPAPVNSRLMDLIHESEQSRRHWDGKALLHTLRP
ncbi:2-dehydropantoate 2-reductase [Marinobacter sp. X15-166B]|uniref:2-dehydropantoate 2-reductase n=1 Tax=Marinobacter sp. X15-166B TaxID=1897620 RepID=UPI00085C4EE7|nr:2-dehydropantoate 2-reductase [Marinobacter sp. X15-166B]OEY65464.1 2-dehydropantoate 2-reductase [Marinobacter sp. X15-166B]